MRWDPGEYGRAFAPVYDDWYGDRDDVGQVVAAVGAVLGRGRGGRLLELGVGTGRLAVPLVGAGWAVDGLDASAEMLAALTAKGTAVRPVLGDASVPADYPPGPFDGVVAAYNFLFNLPGREAQSDCLRAAADVTVAHGALFVEAFVPDPSPPAGPVRSAGPVPGVHIVCEVDPRSGTVAGEHVDVDGRRRPWHVCPISPDELDDLATAGGWRRVERWAGWDRRPFVDHDATAHVSVYRRAP